MYEFVFSWTSPFFRGRFLGRVRVFLSEFFFSSTRACFLGRMRVFLFSYFLFFFYKFPALEGWEIERSLIEMLLIYVNNTIGYRKSVTDAWMVKTINMDDLFSWDKKVARGFLKSRISIYNSDTCNISSTTCVTCVSCLSVCAPMLALLFVL